MGTLSTCADERRFGVDVRASLENGLHRQRHHRGFTLVELLVTLTIAAILAFIAAPSFKGIIQHDRLVAQANDLVTDLNYARAEAIRRHNTAMLCTTGTTSPPTVCATGVAWNTGRGVQVVDGNGTQSMARYAGVLDGNNTLVAYITNTATKVLQASFNSRGASVDSTGVNFLDLSFYLCDSRGKSAGITIEVSPMGQVRVQQNLAPTTCT